jgi:hypothetical protein
MPVTILPPSKFPWAPDGEPRRYLDARESAGSPDGVAYAALLAAMSPEDAAIELGGMFDLVYVGDLAGEIARLPAISSSTVTSPSGSQRRSLFAIMDTIRRCWRRCARRSPIIGQVSPGAIHRFRPSRGLPFSKKLWSLWITCGGEAIQH